MLRSLWRVSSRPRPVLPRPFVPFTESVPDAALEAQMKEATFHHPCFEQPLEAPINAASTLPRTYIASVKANCPVRHVFERFVARAKREGWYYHELPTGHDAQAEMPEALCELLLKVPPA